MSFFEPPPPQPEPERFQAPEWLGPPGNVLGVGVPLQLLLARTERAAVAITGCVVYPLGAVLEVTARLRPGSLSDEEHDAVMRGGAFHLHGPHRSGLPAELIRLGVLFADGRKATSIDDRRAFFQHDSPPAGPILTTRGGSGGDLSWTTSFWLWPLPSAGPLTFVVEWPAFGIPETRTETDGSPFVAAAAATEVLWPEDEGSRGAGGWISSVSTTGESGQTDAA